MNQAEWFYELLAEERGPVSVDHIRMMISNGTLAPSDRIRHSGADQWITAAQLSEQNSSSAEDAGELNDLSELSFSFGSSGDSDAAGPPADELDINSFNLTNEPAPEADNEDDSEFDDMGIDSFNIEGDTDSALPPSRVESPADEPVYYVQSLGQILGPMPLTEVVMMAESGSLSDTDRLREGESGEWTSPLSVTEVAAGISAAANNTQSAAPSIGAVTAKRLQTGTSPVDPPAPAMESKPETVTDTPDATAESPPDATQKPRVRKPGSKGKSRKRKKPKKDELLAEIFSEVFTDDGKVKTDDERTDLKPAGAPAMVPGMPTPNPTPPAPVGIEPSAASGSVPPPMSSTPAIAAAPVPTPPRPMPKPAKKKGSGGGFSMPEPKILGMIGGGLLVVLIAVGAMSGVVSLPALAPDVDGFLNLVATEYKQMSGGPIPPEKWAALQKRVGTEGSAIITYYAKAGSLSAEDNKKRWAVAKLMELVACNPADAEKRDKVFAQFEAM